MLEACEDSRKKGEGLCNQASSGTWKTRITDFQKALELESVREGKKKRISQEERGKSID